MNMEVLSKSKVPDLRFKSVGAFKRNRFGEISILRKEKYNPVKSEVNLPCIELEHLSQETGSLLGYVNSKDQKSIKNVFDKGDVLFGKLRPYLKKYLKTSFIGVCSTEIWVLTGNLVSNDFLFYLVQSSKFLKEVNQTSGSKMPRADWNYISEIKFSFPSESEQQKIASFLSTVDKKINLLEAKIEHLEQYKKGVVQKIFKQDIRFKDDKRNEFPKWEKKKLGELTFKVGKKNKENISYPVYSINNQEGFLPQSEQFEGLDSNERGYDISMYKIIYKETFAYNPARINVGSIGYSDNINEVIISSLYVCFKTKKELEDLFLLVYLDTNKFKKDILRYQEGGVRQYLFYENFSHIQIPLPCNKEQTKMASFLSKFDQKMDLHKAQLKKMKTWKKGLLQKMFV
jgi:type I restriction enzyme S subunit